jgi:hypothetical protein
MPAVPILQLAVRFQVNRDAGECWHCANMMLPAVELMRLLQPGLTCAHWQRGSPGATHCYSLNLAWF